MLIKSTYFLGNMSKVSSSCSGCLFYANLDGFGRVDGFLLASRQNRPLPVVLPPPRYSRSSCSKHLSAYGAVPPSDLAVVTTWLPHGTAGFPGFSLSDILRARLQLCLFAITSCCELTNGHTCSNRSLGKGTGSSRPSGSL